MAFVARRLLSALPKAAAASWSFRTSGLPRAVIPRLSSLPRLKWSGVRYEATTASSAPAQPAQDPWAALGLHHDILRSVKQSGYAQPTPIQEKAIPAVLEGRDVLAGAQTGTGKTAGFVLPILQKLTAHRTVGRPVPRVLILCPTRELCQQVQESVRTYGRYSPVRSVSLFGGSPQGPQSKALMAGVDIIVATPGRLLDMMNQGYAKLGKVEFLVLDEADRMLDMGFEPQIRDILRDVPEKRQTMLFSATYTDDVRNLAYDYLKDPVSLEVSERNSAPTTVDQVVVRVDRHRKYDLLVQMLSEPDVQKALVFCKTKIDADRLGFRLERDAKLSVDSIHGDKSQSGRDRALADFKSGDIKILVATEVAARGLDVRDISHVFQIELPQNPSDYTHRIGRTGRAGKTGKAVALCSAEDEGLLQAVNRLVPRDQRPKVITVPGFEPTEMPSSKYPSISRQQSSGSRFGSRGDSRSGGSRFGDRGESRFGSRDGGSGGGGGSRFGDRRGGGGSRFGDRRDGGRDGGSGRSLRDEFGGRRFDRLDALDDRPDGPLPPRRTGSGERAPPPRPGSLSLDEEF